MFRKPPSVERRRALQEEVDRRGGRDLSGRRTTVAKSQTATLEKYREGICLDGGCVYSIDPCVPPEPTVPSVTPTAAPTDTAAPPPTHTAPPTPTDTEAPTEIPTSDSGSTETPTPGNTPTAPVNTATPPPSPTQPLCPDPTGNWTGSFTSPVGSGSFVVNIVSDAGDWQVSGSGNACNQIGCCSFSGSGSATVVCDQIVFGLAFGGGSDCIYSSVSFSGTVSDDAMSGTLDSFGGTWSAVRTSP